MVVNSDRIYGTYVGSSPASVQDHIRRHGLNENHAEYIAIGDALTHGKEGKFTGTYNGRTYTAVVSGRVCEPDENGTTRAFGLLRSVRRGV